MAHQEHTSIKHFLAVYSNKGGVGKSTIAANLACGMAMRGFRVGLMDGDVHGPSMGLMMGNESHPEPFGESGYFPIEAHGVRVMSMANLVNEETPLIWRGARVHGALTQILNQTNWGELDIMVIDMPPGTGDAQLTLAQGLPF
ncbi:MAG: P-loop NTPase, partial [Acidobacteria bacterium]|nr:P-loop NTPase [Acidobacteriota bacterium]